MKHLKYLLVIVLLLLVAVPLAAKGGKPGGETAGNNLSYPVIWSEGVAKALPGDPLMTPQLNGVWWYQWGTNGVDPDVTPASCLPDPDENGADPSGNPLNPDGLNLCDDEIPGQVDLNLVAGTPAADNPLPLVRAYVQKDPGNVWQAQTLDWSAAPVHVNWIDWGDNLESNDWYTRSQVRTEVVLFQDNPDPLNPWLEYEMRHVDGWGIDEVHGLAADLAGTPQTGPGTRATVYSHCARLTIQKLLVPRDDAQVADLVWEPALGWTEPLSYTADLINPAIFNKPVYEGGDGPGYYSAEINVKGRIIYGYTWNVRDLNDKTGGTAAGDYRITFSFDSQCGAVTLNTFFVQGVTQILVPLEIAASDDVGGASAVLQAVDPLTLEGNNLTYMDVRILERGGGK